MKAAGLIRRTTATAGIAVAALAMGNPALAATSAPRLTGTFDTKMTVVAEQNTSNYVGQTFTRPWKFTPQCASGSCSTYLDRQRGDYSYTRYTLKPVLDNGVWRYFGSATSRTNCYRPDGSLLLSNAYSTREAIQLTPDRTSSSHTVTHYVGKYTVKYVPTAAAKAKGCLLGTATSKFVSVSAPR